MEFEGVLPGEFLEDWYLGDVGGVRDIVMVVETLFFFAFVKAFHHIRLALQLKPHDQILLLKLHRVIIFHLAQKQRPIININILLNPKLRSLPLQP